MTPGAEVCDLAPLVVSRREVLRNLGYPRARRPSDRVAETLDRLWQPALELMTPRGILRLVDAHEAAGTGMPRPACF